MSAANFSEGRSGFFGTHSDLPLLVFLVTLEPVVRFVLGALALTAALVALFFEAYGVPHFPIFLMLGTSVGLGLMLAGYQAVMKFLDR